MDINNLNSSNLFSALNQYENRTLSHDMPLSRDQVSISHRANALHNISQTYFSGTIASDNIPALSQALYEGGFLTSEEFIALGGNLDDQGISITSQANHFLNRYLSSDESISDSDRNQLQNVIDVITNMDQTPDKNQRLKEQEALNFITDFQNRVDTDDSEITDGISLVVDVLKGLEQIRNGEVDAKSIAQYESIQQAT